MCQKGGELWRKFPQILVVIGTSRFTPPKEADCVLQNICFADVVLLVIGKLLWLAKIVGELASFGQNNRRIAV